MSSGVTENPSLCKFKTHAVQPPSACLCSLLGLPHTTAVPPSRAPALAQGPEAFAFRALLREAEPSRGHVRHTDGDLNPEPRCRGP